MKGHIIYLLIFILIGALPSHAQIISDTRYDFRDATLQIIEGASTPTEVARKIYQWICEHIAYDTDYLYYTADECWENKRAVCQGYCELYYYMGKAVGLETNIITGYSKDQYGGINSNKHVWISVKTEHGTILLDPTWGAGTVMGDKFIQSKEDFSWFDIDPHWLIFTHFPDLPEHQYLPNPVDWDTFLNLPVLYPSATEYGWNGKDMLTRIRNGEITSLPRMFETFSDYIVLTDIPLQSSLEAGKFYQFTLKKKKENELTLMHANDFIHETGWQKNDSCYTLRYMPTEEGTLNLSIGTENKMFQVAITYLVTAPDSMGLANIEKHFPFKMSEMKQVKNMDAAAWSLIGVDGHYLLEQVRQGKATALPILFEQGKKQLRKANIPCTDTLKVGENYTFSFLPQGGIEWQIINGEDWHGKWTIDKGTGIYTQEVTPRHPGTLRLSVKEAEGEPYKSLLNYQVTE